MTPPPLSKCGVYLLRCRDCSAVYVGEDERGFRTRINDLVNAYFNADTTRSAFAKHLIEENHSPDEEKLLHFEPKYKRRLCLESIEIFKHSLNHQYHVLNRLTYIDPLVKKVYSVSPAYEQRNCNLMSNAFALAGSCPSISPSMFRAVISCYI